MKRILPPRIPTAAWALLFVLAVAIPVFGQSYFYDQAGRLIQVAYPQGTGIRYVYDDADNLTTVSSVSLPVAPSGLLVERLSTTSARVTWQFGDGATGFAIMRRRSDNYLWEQVGTVSGSARTFLDTTLNASTDYVYRVSAQGANGQSAYSEEAGPARATVAATVNGASFQAPVARGSIATLFGTNLAGSISQATAVPLPRTMAGVRVVVAGVDAPLFYVSPVQINFQAPFESPVRSDVSISVVRDGVAGPESAFRIDDYALGVFQFQRVPGTFDPIVLHADGSLVSPSNPARPNEVLVIYATGVGDLDNAPRTGEAAVANPLATSRITPGIILSGPTSQAPVTSLFTGLAPGFVGLVQLNVQLPAQRPTDPDLRLGIRFRATDDYLFFNLPVAQNPVP